MNKFSSIWVFSDTPSRLPELMNGAQALGEKVNTFVLSDADSATACHLGADHVWLLSGKPEDRMVEDYADVMARPFVSTARAARCCCRIHVGASC
jgi:electron transfer flavoprotein alpha subunit